MTILINVSGYNELQVKFQPWWSRHSPGSPSGVMVPKIHLQSTQTSPRWGILNWPEFIWGLFPFCFMDVMCHFLASEICTSKNLRYSQTFNTPGIMSSCIFSVHWSSITPSTEKAPWDCVHLKVLYELPSHKDSGNQKSSSEFVLCEWMGSRNQLHVSTYVSSSKSRLCGGCDRTFQSRTGSVLHDLLKMVWCYHHSEGRLSSSLASLCNSEPSGCSSQSWLFVIVWEHLCLWHFLNGK